MGQQIKALERDLGTRLVMRTQHGITLTPQGAFLAKGLLEAFVSMAALTEGLSAAEAARPLLVSVTPMFASAFLVPRLSAFIETHPLIELNLDSTIEAVELKPGGVDMAIRYGTGHWPGLDAELLLPGCLTVVASRKLIGTRKITDPRQILEFPLLQEHAPSNSIHGWRKWASPDMKSEKSFECPAICCWRVSETVTASAQRRLLSFQMN